MTFYDPFNPGDVSSAILPSGSGWIDVLMVSGARMRLQGTTVLLDPNPGVSADTFVMDPSTGHSLISTDHTVTLTGVGGRLVVGDAGGFLLYNDAIVGTQAAHVADGSTVDQLRDALIASGLMAAS